MKYFFCFLFFTASVSANERFDSYRERNERFIVDFQDDPNESSVVISLSDGTLWRYHYRFLGLRDGFLKSLKQGLPVTISRGLRLPHGSCLMFLEFEEELCFFFVVFDFTSEEALLSIADISNGKITLSDGSVWQEIAAFVYSSSGWNIGNKIIVSYIDENVEIVNMSYLRPSYLTYHYADVKFLAE